MIEVEVGDTIVEFPDGTHPDVMRSALQKQFPPQQRETPVGKPLSPTQQMLGGAENLLPAAEQGTNPNAEAYTKFLGPATIGETGDVFYKDTEGKPVITDKSKHVVIRDPRDGQVKVFERSADTEEGGVVGSSRVLAPGLATGPLARTPGAARAIKPAAEQGAKATQNEIIEASKRLSDELEVPVDIPRAISSDSLLTQQTGAQLRNVPVLGTPLVKSGERAVEQLGAATGKVAERLGGATVEGAGTTAKESLLDWIGPGSKGQVSKAYDALDDVMDPAAVHRLDSTAALAAEMKARNLASGQPESSRALNLIERAIAKPEVEDSQLIKDLSATMGREGALKVAARMGEVPGEAAAAEGLTFQGTKDLRTRVGQLMDQKILPPEWSGAELKRLYGSLSEDLDRIVGTSGNTSAKALWQKANDTAKEVAQHRKQLSDIVGIKGDATVAEVVDRITKAAGSNTRADIDLLVRAKGIIGEDWDKVVSATTAKMGINSQGQWAPGQFLKDWQKLSPAGKSALYGTGAHKQALEDIARISTRWPQLQKFQNPSGTAQNVMGGAVGMGVVLHPLATLAKLFDPMTAAGLGGAALLVRVLAKPATASSAASWAKSYERVARSPTASSMSHFGIQSRNLVNTLNSQLGTSLTTTDLMKTIQGDQRRKPNGQ